MQTIDCVSLNSILPWLGSSQVSWVSLNSILPWLGSSQVSW
jgi:hypothetical protein